MVGVKATAWVAMSATAARIACSRVSLSAASSAGTEVSASTTYARAGLAVARRARPRGTTIESARIFAMSSSTGRPAIASHRPQHSYDELGRIPVSSARTRQPSGNPCSRDAATRTGCDKAPTRRLRTDDSSEIRHMKAAKTGDRRRAATGESRRDRKSTRLNSSHSQISYAVFCLKKKKKNKKVRKDALPPATVKVLIQYAPSRIELFPVLHSTGPHLPLHSFVSVR